METNTNLVFEKEIQKHL